MKKDITFVILIIFAIAVLLTDAAYAVYVGVTLSAVTAGTAFLPLTFRTFTVAIIAVNAALVPVALSYVFFRRR